MTLSTSPRLGLPRSSADADAAFERAELDGAMGSLESSAALSSNGLRAARPAPGVRDRYYWSTDELRLYYDDGTIWRLLVNNGPYTAWVPKLWQNMATTPVVLASTGGAGKWKRTNNTTVHAWGSATLGGASSGGLGIDLPVPAIDRLSGVGTAAVYSAAAGAIPTDQTGLGFMDGSLSRLILTAFSTGFRDAAAGAVFHFDISYEVAPA